ncbi:MAG: hypothetical protein KF751_21610, partial [Nitrospira sp.]|nr:hypothetical protein [Nitrospira sp.]
MNIDTSQATKSTSYLIGADPTAVLRQTSAQENRDSALLARLMQGDEGAFAELVTRHHSALIRMAMGHVADREVAEEVVQDTW